tara:strand:- start:5402 stop:6133 length:732 start_codon:yes stop_codon:yes gene_type:complete
MYYNIEETNKYSLKYDNVIHLKYKKLYNVANIKMDKTNLQKTSNKSANKSPNKSSNTSSNMITTSYIWILYIILNGYDEYMTIKSNDVFNKEQTFRFKLIELLQKINKKSPITKYKQYTNDIGNDKDISLEVFIFLINLFKINICLSKKYIATLIQNNDDNIFWLCNISNKTLFTESDEYTKQNLENKYYLVENINKPFKCISYYKADDLRKICESINIITKNDKKNKTKKELYSELMNKIEL